jgi:DNA repair protein RecO
VIARGALRPKNRLSGLLEPFVEGRATFYLKRNRDLHTLSDFELIRERQDLGLDMMRFTGASVLCELVLRLAPREADEELFDTLIAGLNDLIELGPDNPEGVAAARIWHLVSMLGFAPSVDVCVDCGRSPRPGEAARFDVRAGGLRCGDCPSVGAILKAEDVTSLRALVGGDMSARPSARQLTLLVDFVRYHASEGTRINSLDYLVAPER